MMHSRTIHFGLISMVALCAAFPALADDLPLASKVEAVTVFPDGALVTRAAKIAIPVGSHMLVLKGLPAGLDANSIRVEAKADKTLSLGTAEIRRVAAPVGPDLERDKQLKALRFDLAGLAGQTEALESEKRVIEQFGQTYPQAAGKEGKPVDLAQWRAIWAAVGEGMADVNKRLRELRAKASDIESEIKNLEVLQGRPRAAAAPVTDMSVAVEAPEAAVATVTVSYRVGNARWQPVYDARLETAKSGSKPTLALTRRAAVSQQTGEDWADVALTLSTTRVTGGTAAPVLDTQALNLWDPPVIAMEKMARESAPARPAAPLSAAPADARLRGGLVQDQVAAVEEGARLDANAFSANFVLPGRSSVTRDGAVKSLRLSSRDIEPALSARIVPLLEAKAYLSARFANGEDAPLLPGEVSLFRDGIFVGKARIGLVAPGDELDLGFGADDRIKVERIPVRRRENDPSWIGSSKYVLSDHRTIVTSLHAAPVKVSVIDRIPVSENSAILVEQLKETTAPSEKTWQDKRGVMAWHFDLVPGEKKEIRVAYRMRWPSDRDIGSNGQLLRP